MPENTGMSIAELNTLYAAAVTAIDAADWDTAIHQLMAVKIRLATMPNLSRSLAGGGSQSITWNAAELDSLIAQCRQNKVAASHSSGGIFQASRVIYAGATT